MSYVLQTCRRHPEAGRFMRECSGCKQELFDLQVANERAASDRLAAKVHAALGLRGRVLTQAELAERGETERRVSVWSQLELNEVFERVGGTVTSQQVQRTLSDGGTWTATEVTVSVTLPDVGTVEVFTDYCGDLAHLGGTDLPVMRALNRKAFQISGREVVIDDEWMTVVERRINGRRFLFVRLAGGRGVFALRWDDESQKFVGLHHIPAAVSV